MRLDAVNSFSGFFSNELVIVPVDRAGEFDIATANIPLPFAIAYLV